MTRDLNPYEHEFISEREDGGCALMIIGLIVIGAVLWYLNRDAVVLFLLIAGFMLLLIGLGLFIRANSLR